MGFICPNDEKGQFQVVPNWTQNIQWWPKFNSMICSVLNQSHPHGTIGCMKPPLLKFLVGSLGSMYLGAFGGNKKSP